MVFLFLRHNIRSLLVSFSLVVRLIQNNWLISSMTILLLMPGKDICLIVSIAQLSTQLSVVCMLRALLVCVAALYSWILLLRTLLGSIVLRIKKALV